MARDGFTTFGLAVAAIGWVALVGDAALSPFLVTAGNLAMVASLRADIFSIAEAVILSGFALAILGTLRSGFGALHQFFDAVLERASAPRPMPAVPYPQPPVAPPVALDPEPIEPTVTPPPRPSTGKGRNYVILANGAVEVDTLLGTRIFASMDEARDYIR